MSIDINEIIEMSDPETKNNLLCDLWAYGSCAYTKEDNEIKYIDVSKLKYRPCPSQ